MGYSTSKTLTRYHIKRASLGILTDMRDLECTSIVLLRVKEEATMRSPMLFKDSIMMVKESSMFSKKRAISATKSLEICHLASF